MLRKILLNFTISRFYFLALAIIASMIIPLRSGYLGNELAKNVGYLTWIWANFDGKHYLNIATIGYKNFDFAFFPLYPFTVFLVKELIQVPLVYIAQALSLIYFLLSLLIIYKIVKIDYKDNIAILTILVISFFPLSFFYHSIYADSLFLLLSTASFYFARKSKWILAGVLALFSTLTRLAGISLILGLLLEWYIQNKDLVKEKGKFLTKFLVSIFPALLLNICGLIIYMLYLKIYHDDPFLFQKSLSAWNQENFVTPLQVLYRYLKIFLSVSPKLLIFWIALLEFVSFISYFILGIYIFKKIRSSYGLYMLTMILLVSFTGTLAGTPRYLLHTFPAFLGLAIIFEKYKKLKIILYLLGLILGLILTGLFTRGYFVG